MKILKLTNKEYLRLQTIKASWKVFNETDFTDKKEQQQEEAKKLTGTCIQAIFEITRKIEL